MKKNFLPIAEVMKILKKPTMKNALRAITSAQSGFRSISMDNKIVLVPMRPCVSCEQTNCIGVAIRNHRPNKQTLFICPECGAATVKNFDEFPFKEGIQNVPTAKNKKLNGKKILG